jgi:hypothetical protein
VRYRTSLLLLALPLLFCLQTAKAQDGFQFLGPAHEAPDQFSPRHHIRYNSQGFDQPMVKKWSKKVAKMQRKGVPDWAIEQISQFPDSPDAIGKWIDEAFDQVQDTFQACGGLTAQRASQISGRDLRVTIMSSAFWEPFYKLYVAGAYYPSTKDIKVLNIYYTWSGTNKGWLRTARELLVWEMGNYVGASAGLLPEPRPQGWPCNAPPYSPSVSK